MERNFTLNASLFHVREDLEERGNQ